ncbi:SnoaL-like polyketide cyclase [Arenibacter palladensis]|uniref:SnoaL-like polyketide cyclase n=1 Tax=Arenibacter palladensis TaxID=237373 RepID=A0A1M5F4P1_9FLAO|nr:ester cyclase [Arenibacter palladensis]SHF86497.1 SnoaL-like polyketide cyclase [Arenibacter palladensis]|tara:strand:+ start:18803 stop:19258 length:456 start_codon:yes stop_codon:yes gene_type:complete
MKKQERLNSNIRPDQLVLEFFDRVWHPPHELEAIDELMTEDYTITTGGVKIKGRDKFKDWVGVFQKSLIDAKTENVEIFFDEHKNKVVSRWVCSGKNNGLFGLSPDQRFISFTGIAIWKVDGNRLAECWVERSSYELYRMLIDGTKEAKFV